MDTSNHYIPSATAPEKKRWIDSRIFHLIPRALQFLFAVVVAALYGIDLAHATKTQAHAEAPWIYAEFLACVSGLTCTIHILATAIVSAPKPAWDLFDAVVFILWLAQVGVFGTIYCAPLTAIPPEYETATLSISRMRAGVWISLVNMLLWLLTTVLGVAGCIRACSSSRRSRRRDASRGGDDTCDEMEVGSRIQKDVDDRLSWADAEKQIMEHCSDQPPEYREKDVADMWPVEKK
ncbi:hypothetical protein P175DRAFT_0504078 [Aspergillus ochraceoroseus IBT 24754]|uniref:MARVEL domain-containing protein n=1 Tax=Aspergillus ochraceoroseus IBT 24754 TaxID=1392256 RepID=A0A2T5LPG9_9EURO|nr:uncharacterized protein P175DRAFT_0504078 [Aspergillus ochraceoroseus IBT 24754]PTU18176.1 hypothetical protein P175DRAFT_0504078 [Aspergillus ochraceoroseus IBT 24754]